MKIIILGAGRIGSSLAIGLAQENNEITLVDLEERHLSNVGNRVDLRTLCGNGAHPNILQQAGAEDADMLVALTRSDEVNMIACQVAYSLFNTPQRIARVRASEYLTQGNLFMTEALPCNAPGRRINRSMLPSRLHTPQTLSLIHISEPTRPY